MESCYIKKFNEIIVTSYEESDLDGVSRNYLKFKKMLD